MVMRVGTDPIGLVPLGEEDRSRSSSSAMLGLSKKAAVCKLGREPSPERNHIGTLILDFQPPEL